MKRIAIVCLIVFCAATATAVVYNETNFNAMGRMFERVPQGHTPGKDNGTGLGMHHPGEECGACHSPSGRAGEHAFTMSGTLYSDRAGQAPVKGGEIVMEDRAGNTISMTSNAAGNFWTTASLASDPYAVSSHSGITDKLYVEDANGNLVTPADPNDPRTWLYKTWVKNNGYARPMVTIAPVGSSSGGDMRMSCSMHHARTGSRAALWGSNRPTVASYPATGLSYRKYVYPILRSKCAPCHIPGSTMTRWVTKADISTPSSSIDYSSGLDLVTYEGSTVGSVVKIGVQSVVNTASPDQSLLLQKTLYGGTHSGGSFWNAQSPDYIALRQWIAEGALKN